jgi:hypothetical protein
VFRLQILGAGYQLCPARIVRVEAGEFALPADEFGTLRLAVLLQPIGEHQAGAVVLQGVLGGAQQSEQLRSRREAAWHGRISL